MDKTLNDTIDSLFRGIVFIIINFVTSAARMIAGPGSGCIRLVRRLYARDTEQVRPFVFLFICLFLTAAAPIFVDAVTKKDNPYEYKIYQNGALQKDAAGRQLYKSISEKIETKEMFVLLLCIIAGVTAFHICARVLRYILFPQRPRRQIAEDCWSYVVGTQALLLLFLYFIDARYGFDDFYRAAPPPAREFVNLLSSAREIFSAHRESTYPCWLNMVDLIGLVLIAVVPGPIGFVLLRRRRNWKGELLWSATAKHRLFVATGVLAILVVDGVAVATLSTVGYAQEQLHATDLAPYAIKNPDCALVRQSDGTVLTSTFVVTVTGHEPLLFRDDDFLVYVGAKRVASDPPGNPRHQPAIDPSRIGFSIKQALSKATYRSPTDQPLNRILLEPGRSVVVDLRLPLDSGNIAFLKGHPDDQRCTVSSVNGDIPAGAATGIRDLTDKEP